MAFRPARHTTAEERGAATTRMAGRRGAHGSAAKPRAGALRDTQAAEAERPRRRDGTPTLAVGDSSGEEV